MKHLKTFQRFHVNETLSNGVDKTLHHAKHKGSFAKKTIAILNFDPISVSTPGTEDKYARGHERVDTLLIELAKEKGMDAISFQYDNILIDNNDIYLGSMSLKDFDYVIMGMMARKTEIVNPILQYLETYKIPHFNYGTPNDRGNKTQDMYNLTRAGLPYVPTFIASSSKDASSYVTEHWGGNYPVVCKVMNGSQGDGIKKCDNQKELEECFSNNENPYYEDFRMVQKFIPNDGDFRILIFDGVIIASAKRVAKDKKKDFRNNMSKGGKGYNMAAPHKANQIALDAANVVGKEMAGVDLIKDKNEGNWYIMEVNSSPQYHYFQEISGIDFPQMLIDKIFKDL